MGKDRRYERLPPGPAEAILERVLEFRSCYDRYEKPDDVNALLELFPQVSLREGYILDYVMDRPGEAIQRILPFARPVWEEEFLLVTQADGAESDPGDGLYGLLNYERSPQGLFEYAFFITELWSTRASWHATEWLASTPIFTRERFAEKVEAAARVDSVSWPDWYGPEARLEEEGGEVRMLVYTEMGWERIYHLEIAVDARGRTGLEAGAIVADLGQGFVF